MDSEALDKQVETLVTEAKLGNQLARNKARQLIEVLFDPAKNIPHQQVRDETIAYILTKLVDGDYVKDQCSTTYNDANITYAAKGIPAIRSDNTPFFLSGDMHFLYVLPNKAYILGRMDGMNHGVEAACIVLTARKQIEELLQQGVFVPSELAKMLTDRLAFIPRRAGFTTMLMSLLENRKLMFTNIGDGGTFLYQPRQKLVKLLPKGIPIGAMTSEQLTRLHKEYASETLVLDAGNTLVSYTDGVTDRAGFDETEIERIITAGTTPQSIVEDVARYATALPHLGGTDDTTVIATQVK